MQKKPCVPDATTGGLGTVAIRCPANDAARRLIELSGVPIAAPSANLSGRPSPTRWEHVKHDLDGRMDALLCGDPCIGGIESTVLDLTDPDHPQVLRPGLITPERIADAPVLTVIGTDAEQLRNDREGRSVFDLSEDAPVMQGARTVLTAFGLE